MERRIPEPEDPIRAEIFSAERLEEYAFCLATELEVLQDSKGDQSLRHRTEENGKILHNSYLTLVEAVKMREVMPPAAEWLIDNFHVVEEQLRKIHHDLPRVLSKENPKLANGSLAGFPRVYALAWALVAHSDSRLETDKIRRFALAFQKNAPLRMCELWTLVIALRIVLVENLSRFSLKIVRDRDQILLANEFADQIKACVENDQDYRGLISQIPSSSFQFIETEHAFIAQLAKRLRDQGPEHWHVEEYLEEHLLAAQDSSAEKVVHLDHQKQAENQVSVGNIITSMRFLSSLDWGEVFEQMSLVDQILSEDPVGSYRQMDFETREEYRQVVEKLSNKEKKSEVDVANTVLQLAKEFFVKDPTDRRGSHVGYYLIGDGPSAVARPRCLPKLDLSSGIPLQGRTMIIVPCTLSSPAVVKDLLEQLEVHYLGNKDPEISYSLVADLDSAVQVAREGIENLNRTFVAEIDGGPGENIFFLFVQNERDHKQGKVQEFMRFLKGTRNTGFVPVVGTENFLRTISFVITLEPQTQLPIDTARKLLGTILHPLNRASIDSTLGTRGYDALLPRVRGSFESSSENLFSKICAGVPRYAKMGIYDLETFEVTLSSRIGFLSDVDVFDDGPQSYEIFAKRQHDRIREHLENGIFAPAMVIWLLLSVAVFPNSAFLWLVAGFLLILFSYLSAASLSIRDLPRNLLRTILYFVFLVHQSQISLDAIIRARFEVREFKSAKPNGPKFWPSELFLVVVMFVILKESLVSKLTVVPLFLLWLSAPVVARFLDRELKPRKIFLPLRDQQFLRQIGRRIWNFFEVFVGEQDQSLPPDSYQEDPEPMIGHRTSPTNIGAYLLALSAAWDLGYLSVSSFLSRLRATLTSMQRLEKFKGHYFNWYDTTTLQPLSPHYVSTVDSGNLAGHILAVRQACLEIPKASVVGNTTAGLHDVISIIHSEAAHLGTRDRIVIEVRRCREILASAKGSRFSDSVRMLNSLMAAFENLKKLILAKPEMTSQLEVTAGWVDSGLMQIHDLHECITAFAPWTGANFADDSKLQTLEVIKNLDGCKTFSDLGSGYDAALKFFGESKIANEEFLARMRLAVDRRHQLLREAEELAVSLGQIFEQMNFEFLLDRERGHLSIGYNLTESRHDEGVYDLLASESRLAYFVAVSKTEMSQKYWFQLGRQFFRTKSGYALVSWSASMFEYLMPLLVMRNYEKTLLERTARTVVLEQIRYGKERQVPWGISESAYNSRDLQFNYQYGPFGVPGLGLKRGLSHDLVVSPYSSFLAAMISPVAAVENLRRLVSLKLLTKFGFYEAVDYTPERLSENQKFAVVRSFMSHHQGMSLVAVDNIINGNIMQNRFHHEPYVRAAQLLLQEGMPHDVIPVSSKVPEIELGMENLTDNMPFVRQYGDPNRAAPHVQLLSNGNYNLMISTAGTGYSKCGDLAITRWREDATRDQWGSFIFLKDLSAERVWSATYQPIAGDIPESYRVSFGDEKVDFQRRDGDISTQTEILVAPEDNAEIRFVSITNHGTESRVLEVTSYLEPVLAPAANDLDHPAFSKLFLETEVLPLRNALLAKRRKSLNADKEDWAFHVVVGSKPFVSDPQYESDRGRFIGRGHTVRDPVAVFSGKDLSNTVGAVLDPIFSLRVRMELAPGETGHVSFTTGLTSSRQEALDLADRYHDIHAFDREKKLAWTKSQVDLRHLNIDSEAAYLFQRVAEKVLYFDSAMRASAQGFAPGSVGANGQSAPIQEDLLPNGISGDLPIVMMSIRDLKDLASVRKILRCHEYLRLKKVSFDLVILNEHSATYSQDLQDELQNQIRTTGSQAWLNKTGGVFVLRSDVTSKFQVDRLLAIARVVLTANRSLREQVVRKFMKEQYVSALPPRKSAPVYTFDDLPLPNLDSFNGFGGFSEDGHEYVIVLKQGQWTPAPWINVIGNGHDFGFQVSESGAGFTWSINSQTNRLTPWSNDPVSDPSGEIIYLRDEETDEFWTPTPLPIREDSNYIIKHGYGYSSFEHISHGLKSTLTVFVPTDESIKISILKLTNLTGKKRRISVTSYTEWVLGSRAEVSTPNLICSVDSESGAIFAQNPFDRDFANRIAFADMSEVKRTFTCSRKEFLGRNRHHADPAALSRQGLGGLEGTGIDPCAAFQTVLELEPNEGREISILLGQCENITAARELTLLYRNLDWAWSAFDKVTQYWKTLISEIQVKTADPSFNRLMNGWLVYQTLSCRFWSRTAFYQSGGAYGYRDQLQDSMALVYSAPELTREHILRAAGRQFKQGDVQHWWHPPMGRGIRTRVSDNLLWLPFVVSFYIKVTGDSAILSELIPFLDGPVLKPGEEDSYFLPEISTESASLFEHCARAIDRSLLLGMHELPLIGGGDWNDGMNRVGAEGRGESVWLGWFLYRVISDFLPFCREVEQQARREIYESHLKTLKRALEDKGWDGNWYRRAYTDDGIPLGAAISEECKIDSISQTWAILSGAGDPIRSKLAMDKVEKYLVHKESKIILLLSPPFDRSAVEPGYIKAYPPGVRENGGQYTHAAIWTIMAEAELGNGNTANELFNILNPMNHSQNRVDAERYKIEPYVLAGDVYSGAALEGRGGWSWYTGSSAWYYRAGLESILGFQLHGSKLSFSPCVPAEWKSFEIIYRYGETKYYLSFENPKGLNQGRCVVLLDGHPISSSELDLVNDLKDHKVLVTLEE